MDIEISFLVHKGGCLLNGGAEGQPERQARGGAAGAGVLRETWTLQGTSGRRRSKRQGISELDGQGTWLQRGGLRLPFDLAFLDHSTHFLRLY